MHRMDAKPDMERASEGQIGEIDRILREEKRYLSDGEVERLRNYLYEAGFGHPNGGLSRRRATLVLNWFLGTPNPFTPDAATGMTSPIAREGQLSRRRRLTPDALARLRPLWRVPG